MIRVATLIGDPNLEAEVAARFEDGFGAELVMRCVDRVELLALVRSRSVDGVVSVGHPHWLDAETIEEAENGGIRIVGLSDHPLDVESFRRAAIEVGSGSSSLPALLEMFSAPRTTETEEPQAGGPRGKLVSVWGPKGAPGRTMVATELAACLAATEPKTLLVDADPYGGDILERLGVIEDVPTIIWAARRAGKGEWNAPLAAQELRRAGERGPVVLPGIPRAELWAEVSDYGLQKLLEEVRCQFAFTVADVGFCIEAGEGLLAGGGRNRMARTVLGSSDRVIAVVGPKPSDIRAFVAGWPEFVSVVDEDAVLVVGNRVPLGQRKEMTEILVGAVGHRPSVFLSDVYGDAQWASKRSRTIYESRPRCSLCDDVRSLAALLGGKVQKKGILTRLGGKS